MPLQLPRREALTKTSDEDPVDYYYRFLTGSIYRKRLVLALEALGRGPFSSLLEIGYGSGLLLPELSKRCRRLFAVDLHSQGGEVKRLLASEHVSAEFVLGSVHALGCGEASFDAVVCLSVLEHMNETTLPQSLGEIRRVSKAGGTVVLGFPARNLATDSFFRLVGFRPRELHPSGHREIVQAAKAIFQTVELQWWPGALPLDLALYVVCRCCV